MLELLRDRPTRRETPVIYHLDVGAMYPNIILSNRLQPSAITCKERCASCPYRSEESNCLRAMTWRWRGEYFPLKRQEFDHLRSQYQQDKPENEEPLPAELKRRVREYCRTVYGKQKETKIEMREAWICQREHPFYVNTIKAFRDRRYEWGFLAGMRGSYKKLTKVAVKKVAAAKELGDISLNWFCVLGRMGWLIDTFFPLFVLLFHHFVLLFHHLSHFPIQFPLNFHSISTQFPLN